MLDQGQCVDVFDMQERDYNLAPNESLWSESDSADDDIDIEGFDELNSGSISSRHGNDRGFNQLTVSKHI